MYGNMLALQRTLKKEVLQLSVKQYIPKSNPNPKPGDLTIIGSHANGFVKVSPRAFWGRTIQPLTARRSSMNHCGRTWSMPWASVA